MHYPGDFFPPVGLYRIWLWIFCLVHNLCAFQVKRLVNLFMFLLTVHFVFSSALLNCLINIKLILLGVTICSCLSSDQETGSLPDKSTDLARCICSTVKGGLVSISTKEKRLSTGRSPLSRVQ